LCTSQTKRITVINRPVVENSYGHQLAEVINRTEVAMGGNYCVTFRIANKTINGKTYDERRDQLIENVRTEKLGFWAEPTSFMLVESRLDTVAFSRRAVQGLSKQDLVFIFDPADMSACYFGAVEEEAVLLSFFPKAKKLE
jgi:hypothetical protein